jgi:Fic family protein
MDTSTKEIINYREAIYTGYDIIQRRQLIGVSDIVRIHETIVGNNAGIRKLTGTSLVNGVTNELVYVPPQDYEEIC